MLEVCGLTKRYDAVLAVDDVSFSIRPSEILGYVGPNGAGKSTTVKMIIGLIEPTGGHVRFHGRSVSEDLPDFQSRIGYVPEESHLYPHLSGFEYLELTGRLRGFPRRPLEAKITEFLHLFRLWDDRDTPLSAYSKGMRQKVLLSAALLHNPDLLILDEPLSGLDVGSALVLRELLHELAARGRMILYSSHVLDVLEKSCTRALILSKGRVVANDTVERLREQTSELSLEGVFGRLAQEQDYKKLAANLLEVMQA
jgi:ABC-2 type transport system ATP-binding protein